MQIVPGIVEKVEQSQLVMKQFFFAMTIKIAGLSDHSCFAVDKYTNDNNIKVLTVSECHEKFQSFDNYVIYRTHSNELGCSLIVNKQLNSYEVKITTRESVDGCFAAIPIEKRNFLLRSIYVLLGNTENIESATFVLAEAYTLCKNENIIGPIIFGD